MNRFTADNPKNNMESAHNIFRIKDGTTVCNLTDDGHEITLFDLIRHCAEVLNCRVAYDSGTDDDISEFLTDNLFDGCDSPEGILAHFYTAAWAFSEIREKLKAYEDSGLTPNEVQQFQNKITTLGRTLKLMATDFYNSSDDDIHTGPDDLIDDYQQAVQAKKQTINTVSPGEGSNYPGLKAKYRVFKVNDNSPVENCFVLRPDKDQAAMQAVEFYANMCESKKLAHDLRKWMYEIRKEREKGGGTGDT